MGALGSPLTGVEMVWPLVPLLCTGRDLFLTAGLDFLLTVLVVDLVRTAFCAGVLDEVRLWTGRVVEVRGRRPMEAAVAGGRSMVAEWWIGNLNF